MGCPRPPRRSGGVLLLTLVCLENDINGDAWQDEDGDVAINDEGGKIFRLQPHWPATSKSSISCIKLDPLNTRNVSDRYPSSFHYCSIIDAKGFYVCL
jgi:hypothetical protein